ncbi:hypothetical protein D3C71_2222560 [compost metagenome]
MPRPGPCSGSGTSAACVTAAAMVVRVVMGLTPVIAACVSKVANGNSSAIR